MPPQAALQPLTPAFLRLFQLDAAFSGVPDVAVLRFATIQETVGTAMSATTTAANGTVIAIRERGVYAYSLDGFTAAADGTAFGITKNTNAAGLTGVPFLSTVGIIAASVVVPNAAETPAIHLGGTFYVSQSEASAPGGALIRFHATDDGGGAPGEISIGSIVAQITRVADWPA